jgi:hypothetical protein
MKGMKWKRFNFFLEMPHKFSLCPKKPVLSYAVLFEGWTLFIKWRDDVYRKQKY